MSFSHDIARKKNKYNGSELYDAYLVDEENGVRHSLTRMTEYSACYYLCLTPKYKKVKRFTCGNCALIENCIGCLRTHNLGCVRGRPWNDYYDVSGRLFSEIFKSKEGEYWIRFNEEAHKGWQDAYTSLSGYNCGPFLGHTGGR